MSIADIQTVDVKTFKPGPEGYSLKVVGGVATWSVDVGGGSQILEFKAKTSATSGDPGDGYILWNNATQVSSTVIFIDHLTFDGIDIDPVLQSMSVGDSLFIGDKDDSSNTQRWQISGSPTFFDHANGSYLSIPVSLISSTGSGTTNYANNHSLSVVWRSAGDSTEFGEVPVTQASHGLVVGDWIRVTGADTYAKADATTATNAEWVGVVKSVADVNNFVYQMPGTRFITTGLTSGDTMYLSDTPGQMANTAGTLNVPVGVAQSATVLHIRWTRPQSAPVGVATVTSSGLLSVEGFNKLAATKSVTVDMIMITAPSFSGLGATDGYTPVADDLIFVAVQGAGSVNNGFWLASAGAWTRPTWANSSATLLGMRAVAKANGNANTSGAEVAITNTSAITIGTTPITVSQLFNNGVAIDGQISVNKWGFSAVGQSLAFYSNGGNSATFSLTRAAGANGNTSMTATGTGTFTISNNNVIFTTVTSSSSAVFGIAAAGATTQLGSSTQTTGAINIGPGLTSGIITLGNAAGTGTHVIQSAPAANTTPVAQIKGNLASGVVGLALVNVSAATTANKFVDLFFCGDAGAFIGGTIRTNSTQAFAWNSASQLMEMVFAVGVGTSLTASAKISKGGVLTALRGFATNYVYNTNTGATATTINLVVNDNHVHFGGTSQLNAATVNLPAATVLVDGTEFTLSTGAFGVTALTLNAGAGTAILTPPGLNFKDADVVFKWKYCAVGPATPTWVFMGGSVSRGVMTHTDITAVGNQNLFEGRCSVDTSLQASATYTLPSSPEDKVEVSVTFGGTVALGSPVITACTITAAQTVFGDVASFTAYSGDTYVFRYNSAKTRWEVI